MPVMTDVATHCPYCALQCGTCADAVEWLCRWLHEADPGPAVVAGEEGAA